MFGKNKRNKENTSKEEEILDVVDTNDDLLDVVDTNDKILEDSLIKEDILSKGGEKSIKKEGFFKKLFGKNKRNKENTSKEEEILDVVDTNDDLLDVVDTNDKILEDSLIKEDILSKGGEKSIKKEGFFKKLFGKKKINKEDTNKEEEILDVVVTNDEILDVVDTNDKILEDSLIKEDILSKGGEKSIKKEGFFKKLFGKKKINKEDTNKEDTNKEDTNKDKLGESNIFEDFDIDSELGKEVKDIQKNLNKDTYDYLLKISNVIKYINIFILFIVIVLYSYIYIQESEKFEKSQFLEPICSIILGDKLNNNISCSSLAVIKKESIKTLLETKNNIFLEEIKILPSIYKKENFLNSKEVIFLLEKSSSRLRPLEILSKFDTLKNNFLGKDKDKILCNNISITKELILNISCYSQSTSWSNGIPTSQNGRKEDIIKKTNGTSISLASSFLDFLEKQDSEISGLSLINKQKIFSIEDIFNDYGSYTQKTPFSIKMKYYLR